MAAWIALSGRLILGKAYMAPVTWLQLIPGIELKVEATKSAFFFKRSNVACFSWDAR